VRRTYAAGAVWSAVNAIVSVLVPIGLFVYFARAAQPWQIGVIAQGLAWIEVIKIFTPLGLYEALLATDDYDHVAPAAAGLLMISAVLAFFAYLGVMSIVPLWIPAVRELFPFVAVLGVRIIFDVLAIQPQAAIARRMDFKRLALRTLIANVLAAIGGVVCGKLTTPVTGLTTYYVLQSGVLWLMTVAGSHAMLAPVFEWKRLKTIAANAFLATQVRSLATLNNFADQIISATFVGPAQVAHYNLGKRVEVAQITAASSFASILFQPLFARRGGAEVGTDFQRSLLMMTLLCGLSTAVFAVNANGLIGVLFGPAWQTAAPIAAALAFGGMARAVGGVQGAYFSVNGHNGLLRNRSLVSAISGVAIVCTTGIVGLQAMAWMLAIKNAAIVFWAAWTLRSIAPLRGCARTLVVLPALSVLSAWLGRLVVASFVPATLLGVVLQVLVSGAACCLVVIALFHRDFLAAVKTIKARGHAEASAL
jgi:teichuronic acid exporter